VSSTINRRKEIPLNQGLRLVVFPVADIAKATALYHELLGVAPYYESAYYTGFRVGDLEVGLRQAPLSSDVAR
jgi:hypothetical protein